MRRSHLLSANACVVGMTDPKNPAIIRAAITILLFFNIFPPSAKSATTSYAWMQPEQTEQE
jgi:hypothetical protein